MDQPTQGPEKRFKKVLGLGNLRRLPELGPAKFTVFDMPAVVEPTPEAVAVACDTLFLDRLAASTSRAVTQVSSDTDALLVDLQQKVPMAVYGVRQQQSATDKVLEDQEGSLSDTIKALEACLQHCSAGEGSPWFTQDTAHAIERMLEDTDALPSISCLLSLGFSDAMDRVRTAYEVTPGVDVVRSTVSHNRWLQRSKLNHVSIAVGNCAGGPVCGIPTIGVRCRVEGDTSGWRLVSFSVPNNIISIGLVLTDDCADTAVLDVDILGVGIRVPLHVSCVVCICVCVCVCV